MMSANSVQIYWLVLPSGRGDQCRLRRHATRILAPHLGAVHSPDPQHPGAPGDRHGSFAADQYAGLMRSRGFWRGQHSWSRTSCIKGA